MPVTSFLFLAFSFILLSAALAVITSKNPVHSVFFLIVAFFNAAGLFVLLGAEYMAMTLVIVYVGAVAVLFLFVVMMLNVNFEKLRGGFIRALPLGIFLAVLLFAELGGLLYSSLLTPAPTAPAASSTTRSESPLDQQRRELRAARGRVLYADGRAEQLPATPKPEHKLQCPERRVVQSRTNSAPNS